jgi:hypothetical protein
MEQRQPQGDQDRDSTNGKAVRQSGASERLLGISMSRSMMIRSSLESESFLANRDYRYLNTNMWVKVAFFVLGLTSGAFWSMVLNCTPYFDKEYSGMHFQFYSTVISRSPTLFIIPILTWLKGVRYGQQIKWSLLISLVCLLLSIVVSLKLPETQQGFTIVLVLFGIAATANMNLQLNLPRLLNYYYSSCVPFYYSPGPLCVIIGALVGLILIEEQVPLFSYIFVFGTFATIMFLSMLLVLILLQRSPYFFKNDLLHSTTDDNSVAAYVRAAEDISDEFWRMFWLNFVVGITFKTIIYTLNPPTIPKSSWTLMMILLGFSFESLGKALGRAQIVQKLLAVTEFFPLLYTAIILGFFFLADQNIFSRWYGITCIMFALVEFRYGLGVTHYVTQVNTVKIDDPNSLMMVNISRELGLVAGALVSVLALWVKIFLR